MLTFSLLLIGYCISLTKLSRWRIETTPFFIVSMLTLVLYVFAYFKLLLIGAWVLTILGGLATAFAVYTLLADRKQIWQDYFTPGFLIPLAFLALMCVFSYMPMPTLWDEFSHWGPHNILLHYNQGLPKATDLIVHQDYPPAGELFHYLFDFKGPFSLENIYVAQTILIFAPLFLLYQGFNWSRWPLVFWLMFLSFFILRLLHADLGPEKYLYMDTCVGVYWGGMVAYFIFSEKKLSDLLYLFPVAAYFVLLKVGVMPLLLLAIVLVSIECWGGNKKNLVFTPLLLVSGILSLMSWSHYLSSAQIHPEWQAHPGIFTIISNFFTPNFYHEHAVILGNFIHRIIKDSVVPVLLLALSLMLIFKTNKEARAHSLLPHLLLFVGYYLFSVALLILYLYDFTPAEALVLASFERYTMIYLIGWALILLACFAHFLQLKRQNSSKKFMYFSVFCAFTLVLSLAHNRISEIKKLYSDQGIWSFQENIQPVIEKVREKTPPEANIVTIWQNGLGLENYIVGYQLMPRHSNLNRCKSYGKKYSSNDIWTCDVSKEQFVQDLAGSDYLLLAYTDENFWSHYGSLFPFNKIPLASYKYCHTPAFNSNGAPGCVLQNESAYLYKIIRNDNQIKFEPISAGVK